MDRTKAEIIVNENCSRDRGRRAEHYGYRRTTGVSGGQPGEPAGAPRDLDRIGAEQELTQFMAECPAAWLDSRLPQRSCSSQPDAAPRVEGDLRHGLPQLQDPGAKQCSYCFAYDLARYTLEPGCAAPLVYHKLSEGCSGFSVPHGCGTVLRVRAGCHP